MAGVVWFGVRDKGTEASSGQSLMVPDRALASTSPTNGQSIVSTESWVFMQSESMGRTDKNPEATERELRSQVEEMNWDQLVGLKSVALNVELGGDQRFMAAYLLNLSQRPGVSRIMNQLASHPLPFGPEKGRLYEQELVIRMQALEGLAARNRELLVKYLASQDNAQLAQQASRLLRRSKAL